MERRVLISGARSPLGQWLEGRVDGLIVEESTPEDRKDARPDWGGYALVIVDSRTESTVGELAAEIRAAAGNDSPALLYLVPPFRDREAFSRVAERYAITAHLPLPVDLERVETCVRSLLGGRDGRGAGADRISASLGSLWEKYRPVNLQRVGKLETAVASLLSDELTEDLRAEAAREAHKLVGAAGTFGFPEASSLAREVETYLEGEGAIGSTARVRISELVEALREIIQSASTAGGVAADQEVLLIVTADKRVADGLASAAARRGLLPVTASTFDKAWQVLERSSVRAMLLDLDEDDENPAGLSFLARSNGRFPQVPVIVLSAKDSTRGRVEVSRYGGRGFFPRHRPAHQVIDGVLQLLRLADDRARILAVDDDPAILEALRSTLREMNVTTLAQPDGFMETLHEVDPDMVILDVDMPEIDGLELCRLMRMDDRAAHVPVMILTAGRTTELIRAVFDAGADDYLAKPFVPEELIARVSGRIMRSRLSRQLTEIDSLSGALNRGAFSDGFDRIARVALEAGRPIAFVLFRLEGLREVNRRIGHAAGDGSLVRMTNRLREALRGEELIGRWGGCEVVMTLFGLGKEEGAQRVESLQRSLDEVVRIEGTDEAIQPWVSVAVAEFPSDGKDPLALFQSAERTRRAADAIGHRAIVTSGWSVSSEGVEVVDVAIVDDDETVAALLVETLTTWRYEVTTIPNGLEAVERLTGPRPSLRARVVLLDVDMPKMDGHSVLRRLRESGVLKDTRVIMLTVRGSEAEVLATMRLGAFDHVTKPFSIPVLLERLRRALDRPAAS